LEGTRAQSCDRYGSGTVHPGQVLGDSLQKVEFWEGKLSGLLRKFQLPHKFRDLLHAGNLRHGTDGFTSPPKEGALRIISP
jgi:hypothetical protein